MNDYLKEFKDNGYFTCSSILDDSERKEFLCKFKRTTPPQNGRGIKNAFEKILAKPILSYAVCGGELDPKEIKKN